MQFKKTILLCTLFSAATAANGASIFGPSSPERDTKKMADQMSAAIFGPLAETLEEAYPTPEWLERHADGKPMDNRGLVARLHACAEGRRPTDSCNLVRLLSTASTRTTGRTLISLMASVPDVATVGGYFSSSTRQPDEIGKAVVAFEYLCGFPGSRCVDGTCVDRLQKLSTAFVRLGATAHLPASTEKVDPVTRLSRAMTQAQQRLESEGRLLSSVPLKLSLLGPAQRELAERSRELGRTGLASAKVYGTRGLERVRKLGRTGLERFKAYSATILVDPNGAEDTARDIISYLS